jgi:flagellar M-ring protein FliF
VPGALAVVALVVFFGLVRPAMKVALAPPPKPAAGAQLNEVVDDAQALPGMPALPAPKSNEHLQGARAMAKQNPAAVAAVVRGWVSGEAA